MPTTSNTPNEMQVVSFASVTAFSAWIAEHHDKCNGIWLRIFKKDSGEETVTYAEALDEALCYGWIDGQANKYDETSYIQKFTPRRPRSIWSKRNTVKAENLIQEGRMKTAGLQQVELAKADGRWHKAYDSPKDMKLPDDFLQAVARNKKAQAFFDGLNKTNRFAIAWKLQTAKKAETREKRLKEIVKMMREGKKFH